MDFDCLVSFMIILICFFGVTIFDCLKKLAIFGSVMNSDYQYLTPKQRAVIRHNEQYEIAKNREKSSFFKALIKTKIFVLKGICRCSR